ncbi:MAG: hypothetical protein ACAH80_18690 [Alphaproteobacteria bacterium]
MSDDVLDRFALGVGWKVLWWQRKMVRGMTRFGIHNPHLIVFGAFADAALIRIKGRSAYRLQISCHEKYKRAGLHLSMLERIFEVHVELKFTGKLQSETLAQGLIRDSLKENHKQRGIVHRGG